MSRIERGTGYDFTRSGNATTINIVPPPLPDFAELNAVNAQLEVSVLYPFKIVKNSLTPSGSIADLLAALATSLTDITVSFIPDTGDTFTVLPGTVNGVLVPAYGPADCSGTTIRNIYVQTYPEASVGIIVTTSTLSDSDSAAYVLIGQVSHDGKTQLVRNSIVMERFKCGSADADYWYSYL
jgi:hypothetical protein